MWLPLLASVLSKLGLSVTSYGWRWARMLWQVTYQEAGEMPAFLAGVGGPLPGWSIPWGIPSLAWQPPLPQPMTFLGAVHKRAGGDHAQPLAPPGFIWHGFERETECISLQFYLLPP